MACPCPLASSPLGHCLHVLGLVSPWPRSDLFLVACETENPGLDVCLLREVRGAKDSDWAGGPEGPGSGCGGQETEKGPEGLPQAPPPQLLVDWMQNVF